jgi:hypothetical protein
MSILSGIGQLPPLFSGGLAFDKPIVYTIPLFNNGTPNDQDTFNLISLPLNLLENGTTYRMLFVFNVIPVLGSCTYATLSTPSPVLQVQWTIGIFSPAPPYPIINIPIDPATTLGFISIDGQITTPANQSLYSSLQMFIQSQFDYPPDGDLDCYTAGQIFFEALK